MNTSSISLISQQNLKSVSSGLMPNTKYITVNENETRTARLSSRQAEALRKLGHELASKKGWWRDLTTDDREDTTLAEHSVVSCQGLGQGRYALRVADAVGVIAVDDLQIVIEPKIPMRHLIFLLEEADAVPRMSDLPAQIQGGDDFWRLIARWYVARLEALLRRDLLREYRPIQEDLKTIRGRVVALPTARKYYSGTLDITCRFEEFDFDSPLNRVLKDAILRVAGSPVLPWDLRKKAVSLSRQFIDVDALQEGDLFLAVTDVRSSYYDAAIGLARNIIQQTNRNLAHGEGSSWSFLFKTPIAVEDGLRAVIQKGLAPHHVVGRSSKKLQPDGISINPDVVIDNGVAVGDVKYKLSQPDWNRSDLYQVIAFAAGYEAKRCVLLNFSKDPALQKRSVVFGEIELTELSWPADENIDPEIAASRYVRSITSWVTNLSPAAV
ncbi:hypothetical protein FIM03_01280 [SAR202 cluster bacterium AD-802-L14_MRT_200m]|nr:hypothetical protein [SAR202 cluster bacterium AD-802-L14_MRT_200m]